MRIPLPTSCSAAYDFLRDYRNDAKWRAEVADVQLVSGTAGEQGAVYEGRLVWNGIDVPHGLQIVDAQPPAVLRIRSESPNLLIEVGYLLEDSDTGCELTATYTLDMTGPLRVIEPFGWAMLIGWVKDDLPGLPAALTADARAL